MKLTTLFPLLFLSVACSGSDGDDDSAGDAPSMSFSLATSGAFAAGYTFDDDEIQAAGGWSGDESDCTNVLRGVYAQSNEGLAIDFRVSGCTILSEGAPTLTLPGQLDVISIDQDESWDSSYYDGAAEEVVHGCEVTIDDVVRWEDSPFHDDHLFASGTYTCDALYSGFSDDDTVIAVQPGTFTIDWTSSEI